jgi:hypothetical protein
MAFERIAFVVAAPKISHGVSFSLDQLFARFLKLKQLARNF